MENIKACIRIKPLLGNSEEDIICGKYDETSVINYRTNEMYSFGNWFLWRSFSNTNFINS